MGIAMMYTEGCVCQDGNIKLGNLNLVLSQDLTRSQPLLVRQFRTALGEVTVINVSRLSLSLNGGGSRGLAIVISYTYSPLVCPPNTSKHISGVTLGDVSFRICFSQSNVDDLQVILSSAMDICISPRAVTRPCSRKIT